MISVQEKPRRIRLRRIRNAKEMRFKLFLEKRGGIFRETSQNNWGVESTVTKIRWEAIFHKTGAK